MIAILAAAVLTDLCTPPTPAAPDPADSLAYTQAGDDARAAGDLRIAAIAYRKAIAFDPANARAREALAAMCKEDASSGDDLEDAVARYREGDLDAAHDAFSAIVARDAAAGGAHLFLGIIALRRHEGGRAVDELELASRDPAYTDLADSLLPLARRDGRFAVMALAAPEVDTNPQLVPDTPPAGAVVGPPQTDVDVLLTTVASARPLRWLLVRNTFVYRDQQKQSQLDYIGDATRVAVEAQRGAHQAVLAYDLDYDVLDRTSYLVAHRGTVGYRRDADGLVLAASYALRRRLFQQTAQAGFTGWVHSGEAGATLHVTPRVDLEARAIAARELTADVTFSNVTAGGVAGVRARIGAIGRLASAATVWYAVYDPEPEGTRRHDVHAEWTVDAEIDLGDHVIAIGGVAIARNDSDVEDFRYTKLTARLGLAVAFGGP